MSTPAASTPAAAFGPLVSAEWLASALGSRGLRVVDVRWVLGKPGAGRAAFEASRIPGATFLELDGELAAPPGSGPGRHPLPAAARFGEALARAGIGAHTRVVAYDDAGGAHAARLWWMLRAFGGFRGEGGVALLDGGWAGWRAAGRPVESGAPVPVSAPEIAYVPTERAARVVDRAAVDALRRDPDAVLLDARAGERYRGEVEPIDPRPGHVPGAVSAPFSGNLVAGAEPRFLPPAELRARYESLGVGPGRTVVAYCGSGVTACHALFALELAGYPDALLYEGSWSDWSSQPGLPAAIGPERG